MSSSETPRNPTEQISAVESDFTAFLALVHHHYRPNSPTTTIDFHKQLSSATAYGTISYQDCEPNALVFNGGMLAEGELPATRWFYFTIIPEVGILYKTVTARVENGEAVETCSEEKKPSDDLLATVKQAILSADDVYLAWNHDKVVSMDQSHTVRNKRIISGLRNLIMSTSVARLFARIQKPDTTH